MNILVKIAVNIIEWLRAHRLPIVVVSAVIVMIVSYALVLPALTMTLDKALEQGGISLDAETESYEESEKQDSISSEDKAEDETYEEAADQDSVSPKPEAEDEDHEEPEKKDGSSSDAEPEAETYAEPVQPVRKKGLRGGMSLMATQDPTIDTIDVNKSYLICYEVNGTYYLLKNDGTTDSSHTPAQFDNLNSTFCWTFNYVFEEKHLEETLTYVYYLIRPIDMKSKTLALNAETSETEPLVQRSNNNVAVVPAEGGGYNLIGYNNIKLNFENGKFSAKEFPKGNNGVTVHIYEMENLPTYSYSVRSADETRGTVTVAGGNLVTETHGEGHPDTHYYEAVSDSNKKSAGTIKATPVVHKDGNGINKWMFDHWEQDGVPLDRDVYPEIIEANTLPIPFNGSNLIAYFKQNREYDVPPNEKQPSSVEDLTGWIGGLTNHPVPLDTNATSKTAEVYDYQNRIYRVDIQSKSNFKTFQGNVDMAFCLDVSASMKFPSRLDPTTDHTYTSNALPIYQINNHGWNYDNRTWLNTSRDWNNPYYLIADPAGTATVFKIYYEYDNTKGDWVWKAQDASRDPGVKTFVIGDPFETNWIGGSGASEDQKKHPFNLGDSDNTTYVICDAGDNKLNRFHYLKEAVSNATTELEHIEKILEVTSGEHQDVNIAYNTFNKRLGTINSKSDREDDIEGFIPVQPVTLQLESNSDGGTRPDNSFDNLTHFGWTGDARYVVLITDGAPQGNRPAQGTVGSDDYYAGDSLSSQAAIIQKVKESAQYLKDEERVKFITVGLSLDSVPSGKQLLYDLADYDKDGNKMFYMAENGSDLKNILRQATKTIMDNAIVIGNVTDTVGDAFYPVDKVTGLPLEAGNTIDIEGRLTSDPTKVAGIVQDDGKTIKWMNQPIDASIGWHGTVYVKAKEDLLGGNAVKTNGDAIVEAEKYTMSGKEYTFDDSLIHDKLQSLTVSLATPRVNINELTFIKNSSEWTVYLGTEVDPKEQLKKLYEDILVEEVVNENGSLHYSLEANSILDGRKDGESNDPPKTFQLAPLILNLIKGNTTLSDKYVKNGELDWDAFLTDIQGTDGVVVPYHEYGTEGPDSNITIKLTKTILEGEEIDVVDQSPHATTIVNGTGVDDHNNPISVPVEKYVLTVQYNPDYDHVLPAGQGGQGHYEYNTGTIGTMYQGHASGRETSTNTHEINVYKQTLDVLKTDESGNTLSGAVFKLYEKDDDNGIEVEGLSGKYVQVASATSGSDGVAHLDSNTEHLLIKGVTYYLVEHSAPAGYTKDNTVWTVQVQTENGKYTDLEGNAISAQRFPFNWDQGAKILVGVLDGADSQPVTVIARSGSGDTTTEITDGSYVSSKNAVSFRHTVKNEFAGYDIIIVKAANTDTEFKNPLGGAEFDLYEAQYVDTDGNLVNGATPKQSGLITPSEGLNKGKITLQQLKPGTYYLFETKAPDGYDSLDAPVKIDISLKEATGAEVTLVQGSRIETKPVNENPELHVTNSAGVELPLTGGPGTRIFMVLGSLLTLIAGILLIARWRYSRGF